MRITECHEGIAVLKDGIWIKNTIKQLAHWEDLRAMGRLAELPCTPGEKIYVPTNSGVIEKEVIAISIEKRRTQIIAKNNRGDTNIYNVLEFGRTIFSSEETALCIWNAWQQLERRDDK